MRVELGAEAEVPEDRPRCVTGNQRALALFKFEGKVYCVDNRCTHVGGPLCRGMLKQFVVTCPLHGSRFDVRSGQVLGGPAMKPVPSYPVTVEGGRVFADVP